VAGVVIVGGGQGGFQTAVSLRAEGYEESITLIGEEAHLPYQRPPLSKGMLLGKQEERHAILRPADFFAAQRIDLIAGERVASIDRARRVVSLSSGGTVPYEYLVLATGSRPRLPQIPGIKLPGVFTFRDLRDTEQLRARCVPGPSPGRVLIDYTNSKGQKLQATLMLPAGYEKGKKYPMLVEFYELRSQNHNNFSQPGYSNSPQLSTYASNGYLVLEPDVVYEIGKPGTSSVDCITAAVKKVIELGYADPAKIGLHGHSWSGYQSSFIVTQTDMFAAVVTGAPPTNLLSFYNELYKSSGTVQQGITTVGQVRMGANVTPFNSTKLYMDQSPIFHVDKIKTPFMILHGMEDGAVDYVEGMQFFNAARAAGKQVILLSYPGEAHNLTNRDNQKDFTVRMKQFFDTYLMDKPMPKWMEEGLPQVKKGGPIRE